LDKESQKKTCKTTIIYSVGGFPYPDFRLNTYGRSCRLLDKSGLSNRLYCRS